jgi:hypothetical protein
MVTTDLVDGIQITTTDGDHFCEGCAQGKQHRNSFPQNPIRSRASKPGQLIHVDLCGPMSTLSINGAYYFVVFKDDCTCYRIVHCLAHKFDMNKSIQQVLLQVKRETDQAVEIIRSESPRQRVYQQQDYQILSRQRHQTGIHRSLLPRTKWYHGT